MHWWKRARSITPAPRFLPQCNWSRNAWLYNRVVLRHRNAWTYCVWPAWNEQQRDRWKIQLYIHVGVSGSGVIIIVIILSILHRSAVLPTVFIIMALCIHVQGGPKSDAKIQIAITTSHLIRINYPLSSFNYRLSGTKVANFKKNSPHGFWATAF